MRERFRRSFKQKLLRVAEKLLQEKGIENVTMRGIAQKLKLSVGSIYTYFPDKEAVLRAIYQKTCREFLNMLQKAPRPSSTPEENFVHLLVLACEFRIKNSYRYREIFQQRLIEEEPTELKKIGAYILQRLAALKLKALDNVEELKKAEKTLLALCEGVASLVLTTHPKYEDLWTKNLITFALYSLLAGWKKELYTSELKNFLPLREEFFNSLVYNQPTKDLR